jgi:hypothetical protein
MRDRTSIFLVAAAAILALLALSGCKDRERTQAAADTVAGIDAMVMVAPQTQPIGVAAVDHALATRGLERRDQLPPAQMTPATIVANIPAYAAQGQQAIAASKASGFWAAIAGGGLVLLGLAQRLGLLGPIGGALVGFITPARQAAQQARNGNLAGAALTMVEAIEAAPPEVAGPVKRAISKALTPEQEAEVRRVLAEMAGPA